ncbi:MAG: NUDIX domain-containing protein [Candidatus Thiodiazotropha sp.]|jgi:isopentenyldiphosphate isomerase
MSDFGMELRVIDEQDRVIDTLPSEEVHRRGLLHRAMHAIVRNAVGQYYVRQRSPALALYPGVWTSSVGEHVFVDESYDDTAKRATREFLGLEVPLELVGKAHVHDAIENELMAVYSAQAERIPALNPEHSEAGEFMGLAELERLLGEGRTTPHLRAAVELLLG